jgi:hypothetical protein
MRQGRVPSPRVLELAACRSPERDEIREWAGDYDPARFDLTAANAAVAAIG